ncbi:1,4-alpha-glucan-branching enzyme [Holothuria leucospilota]|uniref:1,4-alpha-glucan-branching enzyme n=1 Tax=Holothuria leucospilota TaxID=206669 RepID=A0A9Q0YCI6_HOLLE|nr:1,4-alpha-glucan-branching enzyme [Holothuria leucospilota]
MAVQGMLINTERVQIPDADKLYELDPYLKDYDKELRRRYGCLEEMLNKIENDHGGLDTFSQSYKEWGLRRTSDGGIMCREWLPAAKAVFLKGDFNGWNSYEHAMTNVGFGKWELKLPAKADGSSPIPHNTIVKIVIMADMTKVLRDLLPTANSVIAHKFFKSGSININLPSDNLGFWFTQGVPLGLFLAHILMAFVGERDIGRCFVPNGKSNPLSSSQIQYITELCVDQAIHYECFEDDSGKLKDICKSSYLCDGDFNYSKPVKFKGDDIAPGSFRTLFFYRYYIWFLCFFTFIRALPQILWKLYCSADIRKAVQDIAILAEFQHTMCGLTSLATWGNSGSISHRLQAQSAQHTPWMEHMNSIGIEEVMKLAKDKFLFRAYVLRKVADIFLDFFIFSLLLWFYYNRTPFNHLVFVCDLHRDRDNIFLCDTLSNQFIPCTVSFEFQFVITLFICFFIMIFDFVVQTCCLFRFTRIGHRFIRMITCGSFFSKSVLFWDPFISRELELEKNKQWRDFKKSFMNSPNDLYLVGMLYRQSNVVHGHFLKLMAGKIWEQLHLVMEHLSGTSTSSSQRGETASVELNGYANGSYVNSQCAFFPGQCDESEPLVEVIPLSPV